MVYLEVAEVAEAEAAGRWGCGEAERGGYGGKLDLLLRPPRAGGSFPAQAKLSGQVHLFQPGPSISCQVPAQSPRMALRLAVDLGCVFANRRRLVCQGHRPWASLPHHSPIQVS